MTKVSFPVLRENYYKLASQLYEECERFIKSFLNVLPDKKFDISGTPAYEEFCEPWVSLCITYDGGKHPEYATPYAEVAALSLVDDEIKVETDQGDMFGRSIGLQDYLAIIEYLEWWSENYAENNQTTNKS